MLTTTAGHQDGFFSGTFYFWFFFGSSFFVSYKWFLFSHQQNLYNIENWIYEYGKWKKLKFIHMNKKYWKRNIWNRSVCRNMYSHMELRNGPEIFWEKWTWNWYKMLVSGIRIAECIGAWILIVFVLRPKPRFLYGNFKLTNKQKKPRIIEFLKRYK